MPTLRQQILEQIRIIGNQSGCHQRADRSFFYHDMQFPVCARCTGVFFGQITALMVGLFRKTPKLNISAVCLGIMGLDWLLQEIKLKESTNRRRLITGFLGGFGLFSIYGFVIANIVKRIKRIL